jgi:hypothetical protein
LDKHATQSGGDHTALPRPADGDGLAPELWIVALLD